MKEKSSVRPLSFKPIELRNMRVTNLAVVFLALQAGCGAKTDSQAMRAGSTSVIIAEDSEAIIDTTTNEVEGSVTIEELQQQLAHFGKSNWHYGERTKGELVGTWKEKRGDDLLVFGADGAFSESFNGKMTTGLFAISDDGKIVTYSRVDGINLGSHFQLQGQTITGPNGPSPSVQWVRINRVSDSNSGN